ncbi:hypothetical protein LBMAG42_30710 [Deltaproteobacteria bacterium]|nr:hypothetical protein LBMAG42_30710 [Deltaproteobacteria bacterium]
MNDERDPEMDRWRLAELGQQAAMLVHQLRQPLFTIKSLVQLAEADPARSSVHLALAKAQLGVLENLVTGWSDFSRRPTAGEQFDIRMPLEGALVLLRHRGETLGIGVHADLGPGLVIRSSLLGLQQAIVNLGQNALDALDGHDQPELRLWVEGAAIFVSDNGPGLPEPVRRRLFEPYTTTKARGTGLGLPIARALVENAGGALTLEPSERGVRWRIVLAAAA